MSELTIAERRGVFQSQVVCPPATFDGQDGAEFAWRLVAPAWRWSLRIDEVTAKASGSLAGFDLTQPVNTLRETGEAGQARLSVRLGPDEWLLTAPQAPDVDQSQATAELSAALGPSPHTMVDISHRNVTIEVTGARAADAINTGCPLDLGDRAFPPGTATRTLFAKTEIVLARRRDKDGIALYRIECWRSFARYLAGHLRDSAKLLGIGFNEPRALR